MPLVPQVCGKETDGSPERQETPSRPCCSISPTEQKLYTVKGRATHAVTAKAQKEIYRSRAKGTEERHLLPGGGTGIPAGPEPPLGGDRSTETRGTAPVRDLLTRMTENALPLPNPSYDQSNKQQGTAIEYCWETSKSVERDSPKGKPKEKMETWGWKRD